MRLATFVPWFLARMLLTNNLPHFVIALTGRRNITPFGRDSSALVNTLWGAINFVVGCVPGAEHLLYPINRFLPGMTPAVY